MRRLNRGLALVLFLGVLGCNKSAPPPSGPPKEPEVKVALPVMRSIIDYEFFTGRTEFSRRVDLQARVTGYLEKTFFKEGDIVQEGALLFRIDPRPYRIELERAEAQVTTSKAMQDLAQLQEARQRELLPGRAGSREDYDKIRADLQTARGTLLKAEADLKKVKLDLEWTEIRAPFTGRISRWSVDVGNMVKAETILASIGPTEPIYVTFDADERTVLQQLIQLGLKTTDPVPPIRIDVGLVDEPERFLHPAVLNFAEARLDSNTGTLWMRATFDKPSRVILPGLFARVRFPLGPPREGLCVAEQALLQNQGDRSVFVIDAENKVVVRQLKVGRQQGGLREIKSGVEPSDRVVVSGLQRIKGGMTVRPTMIDMPGLKTEAQPK